MIFNFNDKVMQSLLDAYSKCGGDPNELVERMIDKATHPPLPEGEARFFQKYEDDLNA